MVLETAPQEISSARVPAWSARYVQTCRERSTVWRETSAPFADSTTSAVRLSGSYTENGIVSVAYCAAVSSWKPLTTMGVVFSDSTQMSS